MTLTLVPGFNPGPYTGAGNNTYLLHDAVGRHATLIDTATGKSRYLDAVREAVGSAQLRRVLVTHAHADHIAGVPALAAAWPQAEFAKMPWRARDADYPMKWTSLADGDDVPAGDGVLRVLHTPGHAPDHLCFYDERDSVLFSGDLLVRGSTVVIPGSGEGSLVHYLASLGRIRALRPSCVLPAHGPEIDDVVALIDHYVAHRARREAQILAALEAGASTRAAIVDRVYDRLADALTGAARESVLAHLIKLESEGRVRRATDDLDDAWERV